MAENEPTKICPLCAETIKAAAKVCPHCRKVQKRWLFVTRYDLLALATAAVFIVTICLLPKLFFGSRSFSSSRNKIVVLNSKLSLSVQEMGGSTNVVAMGILTNSSDYSWRMGEFELRFLNATGNVIDAATGRDSDGFTVLPHSDHSFRLVFYSQSSIPEHAGYAVSVRSASDPHKSFWED